jgi:hypothetical protein
MLLHGHTEHKITANEGHRPHPKRTSVDRAKQMPTLPDNSHEVLAAKQHETTTNMPMLLCTACNPAYAAMTQVSRRQ